MSTPFGGDAAEWIGTAKAAGVKTGNIPKQGAVAVWQRGVKGGSPQYGHVAFVESVSSDGKSFHVSEYNFNTPKGYGERTIQMSSAEGKNAKFIYD